MYSFRQGTSKSLFNIVNAQFHISTDADNEQKLIVYLFLGSYCRAVSQMGLLMAGYLVSEGGSTAQCLTTIVAVSVLLPEISDTREEWKITLVWQANIGIPGLLVQIQISKKLSMRKMVLFHACFMSLSQGLLWYCKSCNLEALYVGWKPWPKIFIASVLQNLSDHKLDFNHHFRILETTQQKLQLLN